MSSSLRPELSFAELDLPQFLQETLNKVGYERPSPIQQATIPVLLQGKDVVGMAQWAHHALSTRRMVYSAAHVTLLLWLPKARFQPVSTAFCHQQEEWAWTAWPWMPALHACHC